MEIKPLSHMCIYTYKCMYIHTCTYVYMHTYIDTMCRRDVELKTNHGPSR